jgi:hypothetical protein
MFEGYCLRYSVRLSVIMTSEYKKGRRVLLMPSKIRTQFTLTILSVKRITCLSSQNLTIYTSKMKVFAVILLLFTLCHAYPNGDEIKDLGYYAPGTSKICF